MLIPRYWAEAKVRHRDNKRQITLFRFGWSDESQEAAQLHAESRVQEAIQRHLSGIKTFIRERKVAYNGRQGLPIREEIVATYGSIIVTRNLYGARCLNSPDVLFIDVDCGATSSCMGALFLMAVVYGMIYSVLRFTSWESWWLAILFTILFFVFNPGWPFLLMRRTVKSIGGSAEDRAMRRIEAFSNKNPDWHLRLYRTPAGFRLMAMHRLFSPSDSLVRQIFEEVQADKTYVTMCRNQQCFRARVSPKPWRIGIREHMKPRPGVWPIRPDRMEDRRHWIEKYERLCVEYAACRFVKVLGNSFAIDLAAFATQQVHDDLSKALSDLPIA